MTDNIEFVKKTTEKLYDKIIKYIIDTNYSNPESIKLRNDIEEFKAKMNKKEESQDIIKNKRRKLNLGLLPFIDNINNPNYIYQNACIYKTKYKNKNIIKGFQDINNLQGNCSNRNKNSKKKKIKEKILNIDTNDFLNSKFFHHKLYDKFKNVLIQRKDINSGVYDMFVKKLIPKGVDVTPIMNMDGTPIKITKNNLNKIYKKVSNKEEIGSVEVNGFHPNLYSLNTFYGQKFFNKKKIKKEPSFKNRFKLKQKNLVLTDTNFYPKTIDDKLVLRRQTFYQLENQKENLFGKAFNKSKLYNDLININNEDNNYNIKYEYNDFVQDNDFLIFKEKNIFIWKKFINILKNYKILLKKLCISKAYIDSGKLVKLIEFYHGNISDISNKELIMCLSKNDLQLKGYNIKSEEILHNKVKEAFIIRIQNNYRKRLAKRKYKYLKRLISGLIKIQKNIKKYVIRKRTIPLIEKNKMLCHKKFLDLFEKFKNEYEDLKSEPRIEIHITMFDLE